MTAVVQLANQGVSAIFIAAIFGRELGCVDQSQTQEEYLAC